MPRTKKPKVGRPPVTDRETGERYQIYILPSIAAHLLALGDGSLSAGIVLAMKSHENAPQSVRSQTIRSRTRAK